MVTPAPPPMTTGDLLDAFTTPARLARLARARRQRTHGDQIEVQDRPPLADLPDPAHRRAHLLRAGTLRPLDAWPTAKELEPGDEVVLWVPEGQAHRHALADHLARLAAAPRVTLAPACRTTAGLHPLWCVATCRLLTPDTVRVQARFDLLGAHLAQIALGFGADALAGPIEADRPLPLAGATRPTETTHAGLHALVREAGCTPQTEARP